MYFASLEYKLGFTNSNQVRQGLAWHVFRSFFLGQKKKEAGFLPHLSSYQHPIRCIILSTLLWFKSHIALQGCCRFGQTKIDSTKNITELGFFPTAFDGDICLKSGGWAPFFLSVKLQLTSFYNLRSFWVLRNMTWTGQQ